MEAERKKQEAAALLFQQIAAAQRGGAPAPGLIAQPVQGFKRGQGPLAAPAPAPPPAAMRGAVAPAAPRAAPAPMQPPPVAPKPVGFVPGGSQPSQPSQPSAPIGFETFKSAIRQQESGGRYGVPNAEGSGAMGVGQVMPDTERALAKRIGIAYNPELSKGTSPEAMQYQDQIFDAAAKEAWAFGRGNPAMAASYYFGGSDQNKWKGKTQKYAQEVTSRMNLPNTNRTADALAGFMPTPPSPHMEGFDAMDRAIRMAAGNQAKPVDYSYATQPMPEVPKPELQQEADYTKADAAFAAAKPINPFGSTPEEIEKNKMKMRRASYFSGLASGLANYREGQGIGQLLANMGGAALQGRFQGDENVRAKLEELDTNMAKYNMLISNREEGKAKEHINTVNANITTMNRFGEMKYQQAMKDYDETKPFVDELGRLTTTNRNPTTGMTEVHKSLIDPAAINKYVIAIGENEKDRANQLTASDALNYRVQSATFNALLPQAIAEAQKAGDWEKRDQLTMYAGAQAAYKLVQQGTWQQAMAEVPGGASQIAKMDADAWAAAIPDSVDPETGQVRPMMSKPTERQQEIHDNYIASNLVGFFVESRHMSNLVGGFVEDILPGTEGEPGGPRMPRGPERRRWKSASPTVQQSIQAFDIAHTKKTERETPKGTFGTEMYDPGY
ncbi:MAG: lytic transglycosylase domain-containing protein [Chloroflexi bacterium]|nr:MAG: lytic transglycosylase domain-containing protein [Chloroflexota bacterium]